MYIWKGKLLEVAKILSKNIRYIEVRMFLGYYRTEKRIRLQKSFLRRLIMEICRDFYLDKLIKRKNNGLIKVITGIRRCGKYYLLNNIFFHHLLDNGVDADHIIRFAFDSADDLYLIGESLIQMEKEKRGVDPEKFMAYIRSKVIDEGMYYLLLDEIQMLDCFEAVLNGYLRKENMDIFVTGSNAKLLSKDIATEFAGRGDEVPMNP